MWSHRRRIAKADRVVAEAEQRNDEGRRVAQEAVIASRAMRRQVVANHFTELLVAAMQRGT